ncbi:DMT family transporter [Paenibacillus gansuensis]|uniref:DMT family transporter n=1 Tax=Paenibacillus gansuensis TaxID=306542 RepID=A0ABW5PGH6_9BACL
MNRIKIHLMLLGFSVFTGASFNLAKYTVSCFSPFTAAACRFGLAAGVLLLILVITKRMDFSEIKRNAVWYLVLGVVGIFGFSAFFFVGLQYTSSVNGALIMGLNPILTMLLARVLLKERITASRTAGVVLAFLGVTLVISQGSLQVLDSLTFSRGDVLILCGNVCWTVYGVGGRRYIRTGSPLSTTAYTMIVGALCLLAASLFTTNPVPLPDIPLSAWGAIAFMALFTSVLGYLWWNKGIREIGAGRTSLFFNLVPVVTMAISALSGVPVSGYQITGAVLVIFGVLTASGVVRVQSLVK